MQKSKLHAGIRAQKWKMVGRKKEKNYFKVRNSYRNNLDSGN